MRKQISFLPYGIRDILVGAVESMKHLSVSFRHGKQIVYHYVHFELTFRAIPTETVKSHLIQSERVEKFERFREILSLQNGTRSLEKDFGLTCRAEPKSFRVKFVSVSNSMTV